MTHRATEVIKAEFNSPEYLMALEIRRQVFIKEQGVDAAIEIDQYESSASHFLLLGDNKPIAASRMRLKGSLVKFERIAVLKAFRGQGWGQSLTEAMLSFAEARYARHLPYLHAQVSALHFYKKLGWQTIGNRFQEAGMDHEKLMFPPKSALHLKQLLIWQDESADPEIKALLQSLE